MKTLMIAVSLLVVMTALAVSIGSGNALGMAFSLGAMVALLFAISFLPGAKAVYDDEISEEDLVFTFIPKELNATPAMYPVTAYLKAQEYEATQQALEAFGLALLPSFTIQIPLYEQTKEPQTIDEWEREIAKC